MSYWWFVVYLAIFLIGVTKSGFGSGVGLMIVPLTAIAMGHIPNRGSEAALGLLLPLLIVGDFIAVYQYRHLLLRRRTPALAAVAASASDSTLCTTDDSEPAPPTAARTIALLLPGTAVGVILGGFLLWWFHQQPPRLLVALVWIEIGFESILLVAIHWWRQLKGEQQHLIREPFRSHLTGSFAGTSSTLAHAAGPIISMYLLPLHFDRQLYVGVSAFYFFLLNTAKLPAYALSGQFAHAQLSFTLKFIPLVLAGAIFGFWVNRRMNDKLFTTIVYALTFAMGWYMLIGGILKLT